MTRAPALLLATLLLAGCTGLAGTPAAARARPPAQDGAYCSAARGLAATLDNSVNDFASRATLAADGARLAGAFATVAARWQAGGRPQWRIAAATATDLRAWSAAVGAGDGETFNTTVLALWRDQKALPACSR